MNTTLTDAEFVGVRRGILTHALVVIAPVAAGVSVYDAVWEASTRFSHVGQALFNLLESAVLLVLIASGANLVLRAWLAPHARWAVEGAAPSDEDRAALVYLPVRAALWLLTVVSLTTAAITVLNLLFSHDQLATLGIGSGLFLTGFTFSAIVYLQAERGLRRLFALALTTPSVPQRQSVGIRPRLMLAWTLGSALPLLFIVAIPLRARSGHPLPLIAPMLFMAIAGLVLGGITNRLAGRSVAEPIETVRAGLAQVRDGNLDTEVEVTNPGDLGDLLAGFNAMVAGLRERRALEDLFGRHVGTDVARQALSTGLDLNGELRTVSALFVDMVGSTQFAEAHPPREVVTRVNQLFQVVFEEISAAGGWINKFEGDGCLCVFGAPAEMIGHAAHALGAARALSSRLAVLGIDVGIGVSSGDVVAGNVGSVERFEYTVIGRPIHEAARLTDAAKLVPGRLLAAASTVEQAGREAARWADAGDRELRGLSVPIRVAVPTAEQRSPLDGERPLSESL